MATIDALIGELAAGGELTDEGDFTLDRDKARDKMRQFQLSDPHRYVLLLISAAAEKGATRIDFRIDTDDVEMRFDGEPFTREDLEEIYVSMFADRTEHRLRARQDLAVALNAAMALNPRWIRLRSAAQDGTGVAVVMRSEVPDVIEDASDLEPGTAVHVKDRFRPGLLLKFVDSVRGRIAEEVVLRHHCQFSARPICIGGTRINRGMSLGEVWGASRLAGEHVEVIAGFEPAGEPARLIVLVHGVTLSTHDLEAYPRGFVAMADCSSLRRDVSQADVVRDEAYRGVMAMLEQVADAAMVQLVADVGGQIAGVHEADEDDNEEDEDDDEDEEEEADDPNSSGTELQPGGALMHQGGQGGMQPWIANMLRGELERRYRKSNRRGNDRVVEAIEHVRLWTTVQGQHVDTHALRTADERVAFTSQWVEHFDADEHGGTVYAPSRAARGALRRVFGKTLVDRTRTLVRDAQRHAARQQWRSRPREPKLASGMYFARVPIVSETPGVAGEVGIRRGGSQVCTVAVVVDGCLLLALRPKISIPGLAVIVEAPVEPSVNFGRLKRDAVLASVLADILTAVRTAMEAAANSADWQLDVAAQQGLLCAYIWQLETRHLEVELFRAFGFKRRTIDQHLRKQRGPGNRARWRPDWSLTGAAPHPIATLPLFPCLGPLRVVSLAQVAAEFNARQSLWVVKRKTQDVAPPRLVLTLGETRRAVLRALFGQDALTDVDEAHQGWVAREHHLRKPTVPHEIPWPVLGEAFAFDTPLGRGLVGLSWGSLGGPQLARSEACIDVRLEARPVETFTVACAIPGVVAVVDNAAFEDAQARHLVTGLVMGALVEALTARLPKAAVDVEPGQTGHLQWMLNAALSHQSWHRAFRVLLDELGPGKGHEAYVALVSLRLRWPMGVIAVKLSRAIRKRHIDVAAIELALENDSDGTALGESDGVDVPDAKLRVGMAGLLPQLQTIPMYETAAGGMASLDDLWACLERGERIGWLRQGTAPHGPGDSDTDGALVLRLTSIELYCLQGIFGGSAFEGAPIWRAAIAKRRAFESQPQLESLTIAEHDALVRVRVSRRGFHGEIALWRRSPGAARPTVVACRDKRVLATVEPQIDVPVIAVLSSPELGDEAGGSPTRAGIDRLGEVCRSYVDDLVTALATEFGAMSGPTRALGEAWVRWFMLHRGAPVGRSGIQVLDVLETLAVFPMVATSTDPAEHHRGSLEDLKESHRRHGRLRAVFHGDLVGVAVGEEAVLDLRDPVVREEVEGLFGVVDDHHELAVVARATADRRRLAPPLPQPPGDALAVERLRAGGVRGHLWVEPPALGISWLCLGAEGRTVSRRDVAKDSTLANVLPCAGGLEGMGIDVDDAFATVHLEGRAVRAIERASLRVYGELAEIYGRRMKAGATPAQDVQRGRVPLAMLRTRLVAVALRLAREQPPVGDAPQARKRLGKQLSSLPLLALSTGRMVSIAVARRERPQELWHLGLWDGEQAVLDVVPEEGPATSQTPPEQPTRAAVEHDQDVSREAPTAPLQAPRPEPRVPKPRPPTAAERLLEAIRSEIRLVRERDRELLSDAQLDGITVETRDGALMVVPDNPATIDAAHPIVARVLQQDGGFEPVAVSFLVSAVYTAINIRLSEVTDSNEVAFLGLHGEYLASAHRV